MKIGRTTREIIDIGRDNPFSQFGEKRRFMISIFYPSHDAQDLEEELMYPGLFHPGEDAANEFFKNIGADIAYLSTLKTNVYRDISIHKDVAYPVIIYSPAFGIERDMYWFNISNLVSSGFIVVTVGATYDSVFTVFPDGEYIQQLRELADLEGTDFAGWESLVEIRTQDISYLLDKLPDLNENDVFLKRIMDLQKIGLIGHSLGGAAVFRILQNDSRILSGVLLDPSLHLLGSNSSPLSTPVLLLRQNSSTFEMLIEAGWNENLARETMNGQILLANVLGCYKSFIKIHGANHVTFSDAPIHFNEPDITVKHGAINEAISAFFKEFVCAKTGEYTKKIGYIRGLSLIESDGTDIE